jgi:hypothetical protein
MVELYLHSPICLHGTVFTFLAFYEKDSSQDWEEFFNNKTYFVMRTAAGRI